MSDTLTIEVTHDDIEAAYKSFDMYRQCNTHPTQCALEAAISRQLGRRNVVGLTTATIYDEDGIRTTYVVDELGKQIIRTFDNSHHGERAAVPTGKVMLTPYTPEHTV